MSGESVEGIVLRHVNFQDSDRIVTLFTRERGRLEGRARGVRKSSKRFQGRLDLFTRAAVVLGRRGILDGAEVLEAYLGMRADLTRLAWAGALAELSLQLFGEGEPHPRAYDLLIHALEHLDRAEAPRRGYLHILELSLLREAGLMPELLACVACGDPVGIRDGERLRPFSFVPSRGGALCARCQGGDAHGAISPGTFKLLERGMALGPEGALRLRFNDRSEGEIAQIIRGFLTYHVSGRHTARRFLEDTWALE